jgi:hypothetical protein
LLIDSETDTLFMNLPSRDRIRWPLMAIILHRIFGEEGTMEISRELKTIAATWDLWARAFGAREGLYNLKEVIMSCTENKIVERRHKIIGLCRHGSYVTGCVGGSSPQTFLATMRTFCATGGFRLRQFPSSYRGFNST